jgi:glycosyltransferase involved in cell wall biosynthesis
MTRVVFFSSYTGLGGGETSLRSLLGSLDRTLYLPVLICPREGALPESVRKLGIEARVLPYRGSSAWFVPFLWERFPVVERIVSVLSDLAPGVVHSDFHTLPFLVPACRRLNIPLIFTVYGWWFRPKPWQRRFYQTGPQSILAISEAVKQGFLGDPPFMPPESVRVQHLGVDTDIFRPRPSERAAIRGELKLPPDAPLVTLIGRFQNVKGQDVFLDAAGRIAQKRPDARFAMAGENVFGARKDEAFKRRVLSIAESDPILRERVSFLGWIPQSEKLLAASDVVVCSSFFESFGMALVEAMASGVPVVSTNVGGPAETIVDGTTGYLVPPVRPDLIAECVLSLLADEGLRRRMGAAGRERALRYFSLKQYASGFSKTVAGLTGSNRTG